MNKKLQRIIAGTMSTLLVGQIMIFGDGTAQGILHANTIASAADAVKELKNAKQLAQEFDEAMEGLGEVDYFTLPASKRRTARAASKKTKINQEDNSNPQMFTQRTLTDEDISLSDSLTITGRVCRGTVENCNTPVNDSTPVYIRIFNGDWEEIACTEIQDGENYSVSAKGSNVYHVKFECDGYLPFYLKDFGTGTYQIGSGDSKNTITLIPGDTTYNEDNGNQWSDDVFNANDTAYVHSLIGSRPGDDTFNFSLDLNGDGMIDGNEQFSAREMIQDWSKSDQIEVTRAWNEAQKYDLNGDFVINNTDFKLIGSWIGADASEVSDLDTNRNGIIDAEDVESFISAVYSSTDVYLYNLDLNHNGFIDEDDLNYLDAVSSLKESRGEYHEYMDKDANGEITNDDYAWFVGAYDTYGDLDWDHAFKKNITVLESGYFPYSLNLHDTNLDLNGCALFIGDCMSFTTDIPIFWENGAGAELNINGGMLSVQNNLVFRTASPDGWTGNAGQTMNLNGGTVYIGADFNFGQSNCYDTVLMTNDDDLLIVEGNWNYITLMDMEGKWSAGQIWFLGPTWQVNELSGEKSIYSSGTQSIIFGYEGGKQTILWDNPETYINNEDGSYNTNRRLNFDYEYGILFTKDFTEENYWFRPWWRAFEIPDYTLYRKGWEIGDGVHIATGNYTRSFTDLSVASPGVKSDFVRTYNSMSDEEGSFGIGWDFNIDVSKIVIPAEGYYQVVLPDGSNTTFKDDGNGGFECLNAHSIMTKSGEEYTVTNAAQSQYHFNSNGELDWVKDANGNTLQINTLSDMQKQVVDSTGRTYTINYRDVNGHKRIDSIGDDHSETNRIVTYAYNGDAQLVSATSVSGGTEYYEYDGNGRLCKITNCYDEITDQMAYYDNGSVDWLTNAAGLKQVYTYDKAFQQTGLEEYDGETLVKTFTYNYDEKYAVKINTVETDGQTYEVDKITYRMVDGEN
ncbi:MAG: hypothetical protein K2G25_06935, partial [Oscillospiraceae bacterium]|nr:hypothetical protein [Oscillospiraceae bacterium]